MKEVELDNNNIAYDNMTKEEKVNYILENHKKPFSSKEIQRLGSGLQAVEAMFPEFGEEIMILTYRAQNDFLRTYPKGAAGKYEMGFIPFSDEHESMYFNDPETRKKIAEFIVDIGSLIKKMKDTYSSPLHKGYSEEKLRHLNLYEKRVKLAETDDAEIAVESDSMFSALGTSYVSMPTSRFKDEKTGEYKEDKEKYKELLEKYPFVNQAEDRMSFITEKYIPYIKNADKGEISDKEAIAFKKEYQDFLNRQKKYFEKIRSIKEDDKLLTENEVTKTSGFNGAIRRDWQYDRFGDNVMTQVETDTKILNQGWGVRDIPFIKQYQMMKKLLKDASEKNTGSYDAVDRRKATEILNKYKTTFDKIEKTYISTPEIRTKLLNEMKNPVKEMDKWTNRYMTHTKLAMHTSTSPLCHSSFLGKFYEETVKRPVIEAEIGNSSANKMVRTVNGLVDALKKVEISKFSLPSGEFGLVKDDLLALQKYANTEFRDIKATNPDAVTAEQLQHFEEFKKKAVKVMGKVEKYLEHKEEQFDQSNGARKTEEKRQKREQPRIKTTIKIFDVLSDMVEQIDEHKKKYEANKKDPFEAEKNAARERCENRLAQDAKNLQNADNQKDYMKAVISILIDYQLSKPSSFKQKKGETQEAYENRIKAAGRHEYSNNDLKTIIQSYENPEITAIYNEEVKKFVKNENGEKSLKPGETMASAEDLKKRFDEKIKARAKKIDVNKETEKQQRDTRINRYKEKLVNQQNQYKVSI